MPSRRLITKLTLALLTVVIGIDSARMIVAQEGAGAAATEGRKLPLKEQLTLGLKATTKADKEFINLVVQKVEQGTLPRPLVDSTFLWARERANRKSPSRSLRPMVYFRPALAARAKMMHLTL
jgi:hypothetical protein